MMSWRSKYSIAAIILLLIGNSSAIRDLKNSNAVKSTQRTQNAEDYFLGPDLSGHYDDSETADGTYDYPPLEGSTNDDPSAASDGADYGGLMVVITSSGGDSTAGLASISSLAPLLPSDSAVEGSNTMYSSDYTPEDSEDPANSDQDVSELVQSQVAPPSPDGEDAKLSEAAAASTSDADAAAANGTTDGDTASSDGTASAVAAAPDESPVPEPDATGEADTAAADGTTYADTASAGGMAVAAAPDESPVPEPDATGEADTAAADGTTYADTASAGGMAVAAAPDESPVPEPDATGEADTAAADGTTNADAALPDGILVTVAADESPVPEPDVTGEADTAAEDSLTSDDSVPLTSGGGVVALPPPFDGVLVPVPAEDATSADGGLGGASVLPCDTLVKAADQSYPDDGTSTYAYADDPMSSSDGEVSAYETPDDGTLLVVTDDGSSDGSYGNTDGTTQ